MSPDGLARTPPRVAMPRLPGAVVPYATALELQRTLLELRKAGRIENTLLLLEHPPVITLGRNARLDNVLASLAEYGYRANNRGTKEDHFFRVRNGQNFHIFVLGPPNPNAGGKAYLPSLGRISTIFCLPSTTSPRKL